MIHKLAILEELDELGCRIPKLDLQEFFCLVYMTTSATLKFQCRKVGPGIECLARRAIEMVGLESDHFTIVAGHSRECHSFVCNT
jgi:hypothetical protein